MGSERHWQGYLFIYGNVLLGFRRVADRPNRDSKTDGVVVCSSAGWRFRASYFLIGSPARNAWVMPCMVARPLFHESVSCLCPHERSGQRTNRSAYLTDEQPGEHKQQANRRQGVVPWIVWDSMDEHGFPLYMALCRFLQPPHWTCYTRKTGSGPRRSGTDGKQFLRAPGNMLASESAYSPARSWQIWGNRGPEFLHRPGVSPWQKR